MSLTGIKKNYNKANQFVNEKIGTAKGTELDGDYIEMERKTDVMYKLSDDLVSKTFELLQPNPVYKTKLSAFKNISKLRGNVTHRLYPQTEGILGEGMIKYGKELGEDSILGGALDDCGETYKQLADIKYILEDNVRQNFIGPLLHLHSNDLKEVLQNRKKVEGRRLELDCKMRKHTTSMSHVEKEKFNDAKDVASQSMNAFLERDAEFVTLLSALIEALSEYHESSYKMLQSLSGVLGERLTQVKNRPRFEYSSKRFSDNSPNSSFVNKHLTDSVGYSLSPAPNTLLNNGSRHKEPSCQALYDFEPENDGELGFMEGDIIKLIARLDENWFEGSSNGRQGFFPVTYVKEINPL